MPAQQINYKGFIGASYTSRSLSAAAEETINLFPETIEDHQGKALENIVLYRTPGLQKLSLNVDALSGPIQGMFAFSSTADIILEGQVIDTAIVVSGTQNASTWNVYRLYVVPNSVPLGGNLYQIGTIIGPGPLEYVSFAANDHQVLIVSDPNAYLYDAVAGTFAQVTADGYNGGVTATCVDGYFVVNNPNSNSFSVSAFNDGSTWSGIDQESTQDYPDTLRAVANYNHYLQLFSGRRSEVYYDTGSTSALFARYEGSYQYQGIAAPWSIAYQDNTIFYLGQNEAGAGVVYRLEEFGPKRVSNMAMESQIQDYEYIQDAYGWAYQDGGHLFYVLHFPSAMANPLYPSDNTQPPMLGVTWVYDATVSAQTQVSMWHKRLSWNPVTSQYTAHAGRFYMYAGGMHLVGDFATAAIYRLSLDYPNDNGMFIRWLRSAPQISTLQTRDFYRWMQLDMQTGTNLNPPIAGTNVVVPGWGINWTSTVSGSTPTVSMQWSDDGGFSWGSELQMIVSQTGQFRQQAVVNRLGYARDFAARCFGTDPNTICLVNAFLGVERGNN